LCFVFVSGALHDSFVISNDVTPKDVMIVQQLIGKYFKLMEIMSLRLLRGTEETHGTLGHVSW
jgi:hypothetical protein